MHLRKLGISGLLLLCAVAGFGIKTSHPHVPADHIIVLKSRRIMDLYAHGKLLKEYRISLGGVPEGPKQTAGDHRTPEGSYIIDSKNAHSRFHLALHISYPNPQDRAHARQKGVNPGGDIMIHGLPPAFAYVGKVQREMDWTDGCIAVSNQEIEEIWSLVPVGTRIDIKP